MKRRPVLVLISTAALALGFAAPAALAQGAQAGPIAVQRAWARPTAAGQRVGAAYMSLRNGGSADRLVAVSSTLAERVELHSMTMDGEVMRMRQLEAIELPAGQAVELEPGGLHLMLIGLKQPLKAGQRLPLRLKFAKAGELSVELPVGAAPAGAKVADEHAGHEHGHGGHKH